jgi:hypothetical protein
MRSWHESQFSIANSCTQLEHFVPRVVFQFNWSTRIDFLRMRRITAVPGSRQITWQMLCFTTSVRRACIIHTQPPFIHARSIQRLPHVLPRFSLPTYTTSIPISRRAFQDLAPGPEKVQTPPSATVKRPSVTKELYSSDVVTAKEQRRNDWNIIRKLMVNVWPKNDWKTRGTVLLGFGLLVTGKVSGRA